MPFPRTLRSWWDYRWKGAFVKPGCRPSTGAAVRLLAHAELRDPLGAQVGVSITEPNAWLNARVLHPTVERAHHGDVGCGKKDRFPGPRVVGATVAVLGRGRSTRTQMLAVCLG